MWVREDTEMHPGHPLTTHCFLWFLHEHRWFNGSRQSVKATSGKWTSWSLTPAGNGKREAVWWARDRLRSSLSFGESELLAVSIAQPHRFSSSALHSLLEVFVFIVYFFEARVCLDLCVSISDWHKAFHIANNQ